MATRSKESIDCQSVCVDSQNMAHDGHHHHDHSHHHHHHHHHGAAGNIGLAFILNFSFSILEVFGGLYTNSVAILSDALHDFGDSLALLFAYVMEKLSHKKSDQKYSYGYRRYSTLAALVTGILLVIGSLFIFIHAIPRLIDPVAPDAKGMFFFALLGVAVNGFAAYRVSRGSSLNERMITWHLIEDVAGWVLVLISSIIMNFWDIPEIDAALACVMALWILYNVFKNLREAFEVFLQATPMRLDQEKLTAELKRIPHVIDLHHSHIWSLDSENHVFTTHVVLNDQVSHEQIDQVKSEIKKVAKTYSIMEATIEIEFSSSKCEDPQH